MFKLVSREDGKTYYLGSVLEPEVQAAPRRFFLGYDEDMVHVFKHEVVRDSVEEQDFLGLFITLIKAQKISGQVERV